MVTRINVALLWAEARGCMKGFPQQNKEKRDLCKLKMYKVSLLDKEKWKYLALGSFKYRELITL